MLIETYSPNYVIFDLETTGVGPDDSIIEIGAIRVVDAKMVESFCTFVNSNRHIPIEASSVNHIYDKDVESAPSIAAALETFLSFIQRDILVGHNIHAFDMKLVSRDCKKYLNKDIVNDYVDSVLIARKKLSHLSSRSLGYLAQYYGVSYEGAHRALQDCGINYQVYERLIHQEVPKAELALTECPLCKSKVKLRLGRYGRFFGCSSYPQCQFTQPVYY